MYKEGLEGAKTTPDKLVKNLGTKYLKKNLLVSSIFDVYRLFWRFLEISSGSGRFKNIPIGFLTPGTMGKGTNYI